MATNKNGKSFDMARYTNNKEDTARGKSSPAANRAGKRMMERLSNNVKRNTK